MHKILVQLMMAEWQKHFEYIISINFGISYSLFLSFLLIKSTTQPIRTS